MTESDFKSLMTTDLFNVTESELEQILKVYAPKRKEICTAGGMVHCGWLRNPAAMVEAP